MKTITILKNKILACLFVCSLAGCKADKELIQNVAHDPSKPLSATTYYPNEGGMATKLIINGSNFGSDPSKIRVWYNSKRASVIGADGNHLYVVTPRQPGETCTISIAVGNDSVTLSTPFIYHTTTIVTTIAGQKGSTAFLPGTLSSATFANPQRITVDNEGNIYGAHRNGNLCFMLNEAKDIVMQLPNVAPKAGSPTLDVTGKVVTFPDDDGDNYYTFDADLQWAGRRRTILHPSAEQQAGGMKNFTIAYKTSFTTCEIDSMIYTWDFNVGALVKFDPNTRVGQLVAQFPQAANSHGMLLFHPVNKHILYIGLVQKYAIYTYNILTGEYKPFAGVSGVSGWRDGDKADSYLGELGQFVFDANHELIFSDAGNHCIRKIDKDGQVSTIIGRPRVSGYQDGNPEDALFNYPRGMCIDKDYNIYISDTNNNCIRKLSIQ